LIRPTFAAMDSTAHFEKTFTKVKWSNQSIPDREFEACTFTQCDLSHSDFSHSKFAECTFTGCDLSMVKLPEVLLRDVTFKECKLLGVDFSLCKEMLFSPKFEQCMMDHAVFHKRKMNGTKFIRCTLKSVDFENAHLENAVFERCDLERAVFVNTHLQKADFSKAFNMALDPERNKLKGAKFSVEGALALLAKYGLKIE
jgi:fluoroquinolone resistance protein